MAETGVAVDRVREMLDRIVEAYALEARVEVVEDDEAIQGTLKGGELGLVIGRRGETIDALEHLASRIAFRGERDRKRVILDAEGYRERRAEALRGQGDRAAAEALKYDRQVALDDMSAAERRVVHEHLRDRTDVETHSEGEEPHRHLVVSPTVM